MKAPAEELLYFLLWTADSLMRPTWRNLNGSFESWAWRNGLGRRLAELEQQKLIERRSEPNLERVVRLTEQGRRHVLGGRDPVERWSRPWDRTWRMVLFDLPTAQLELRKRLWRTLRAHHFGFLQNSVWISPDPATSIRQLFGGSAVQADTFLLMEGRPAAGESDEDIVLAAWDFEMINERYEQHLRFLERTPPRDERLIEWARREKALWHAAIAADPLLPSVLLPRGYQGRVAFERRQRAFATLIAFEREVAPKR